MEKRTKTQIVTDSIVEAVKEEAAGIVGLIPGVGRAGAKAVEVAQKAGEKANESIKSRDNKPPKYMQSVKFCCKKTQGISDEQRRELEMIFTNEYESFENKSLEDIEDFIDTYVGRDMDTGEIFEYNIAKDYLWIHLYESERFLYDGECLQKTLNALNTLLREEVFERFEAWGYDEEY